MISSIFDVVLFAALASTSCAVLMMYRRLQRFDALQGQAAKEFARSAEALDKAREAIAHLHDDGGEMAVTLASRLNEARMIMNDIDEATTRTREAYIDVCELQRLAMASAVRSEPAPAEPIAVEAVPVFEPADAHEPAAGDAPEIVATEEEVHADEVVSATLPAAIRIRDAARARIAAAREKAAAQQSNGGPRPPRPQPSTQPSTPPRLPDSLMPRIHRAPEGDASVPMTARAGSAARAADTPVPNGPVMMLVRPDEDDTAAATSPSAWSPAPTADGVDAMDAILPAAAARQVTWHDLARAAQHAG